MSSTHPVILSQPNPFALSEAFISASVFGQAAVEQIDLTAPSWWFVCQSSSLWVSVDQSDRAQLPTYSQLLSQGLIRKPLSQAQILGQLAGQNCIAIASPTCSDTNQRNLSAGPLQLISLRSLYGKLPDDLFGIGGRAVQLIEWDLTHQFCGRCATALTHPPSERVKHCPNCQLRQYPKLSPAVIMLIHREEQILLARAPRFRPGMYSVLAGFVEPGESLEEAVIREVREEVGIEITNIRYFGSQPWPFPKSLMLGFVAEYASGELTPDPVEIEAAEWFDKTSLPPVPGELSIARKLIDWFVEQ